MRVRVVLLMLVVAVCALPAVAHARPAQVTWCGNDEVAADRQPDLVPGQTVRFVYVTPSDGPDNFKAYASGIASDAAQIDAWWRLQDPTRTPRFDRYPFPGCTSTFGDLDIGFVRLPRPDAAYAPSIFQSLWVDLITTLPPSQRTIVYYDGSALADAVACGRTGTTGTYNLSIVYLRPVSGCDPTPLGEARSSDIAAHELLHNLGAVSDAAPHVCGDSHVCDSDDDIMTQHPTWNSSIDNVQLDVGHDDYYGHSGSWPDVQDSPWLEHLPERALQVQIVGQGHVDLAGADLAGCGSAGCTIDSSEAVLTGVPEPGWDIHWSGTCTVSDATCTVPASGPVNVTATFVQEPYSAHVVVKGKGRVTSVPAGLACTTSCRATFAPTSPVRLVAHPSTGWRFVRWSGDCAGAKCSFDGEGYEVVATFAKKPAKKKR